MHTCGIPPQDVWDMPAGLAALLIEECDAYYSYKAGGEWQLTRGGVAADDTDLSLFPGIKVVDARDAVSGRNES